MGHLTKPPPYPGAAQEVNQEMVCMGYRPSGKTVIGQRPVSTPKRRLLHPTSKRGADKRSCHQHQDQGRPLSPMGTPISSQSCYTPCWQAKPVPYIGQPQLQGHWRPNTHLSDSKSGKQNNLAINVFGWKKRLLSTTSSNSLPTCPASSCYDWECR